MKNILAIISLSAFLMFISCSNTINAPVTRNEPGAANVSLHIGQISTLGKNRTITLSKLYVALSATGETTQYDTFALSGNNEQTFNKTYNNLASLVTWTLTAESRDVDGIVIHSGLTHFIVTAQNVIPVSLNLSAKYSMLKANFFPIKDSVTRCELLINGVKVDDSSFAKQSHLGDTVKLSYNYLDTGAAQRVRLKVYGTMWGFDTLLYSGDTAITPVHGANGNYNMTLKWVGPALQPSGQASMSVVLGAVGTVTLNGKLEEGAWTTRSSGITASNYFNSIAVGNNMFVAVGQDSVVTSSDGVTWTKRYCAASNGLNGVCFGNNLFVAVGQPDNTSGVGEIATSSNGITWTSRYSGASDWIPAVTWGNGLFVAVEWWMHVSSDGITWTDKFTSSLKHCDGITYGNNLFIAVGMAGVIYTSADGSTWTERTSGTGADLKSAVFGNGKFVAVGLNGTILSSPNGTNWTAQTSGTSNGLRGITFGNNQFVAVGLGGTILGSTDGSSWTAQTSGSVNDLNCVVYGNNKFVAVGVHGTILTK